MKTLYLLRHGKTAANGRFVGSIDIPVDESGYGQLSQSRLRLQQKAVTKIFCSPKLRCRQSADFLGLDADLTICNELREIDFGEWEGLSFAEINSGWPDKVVEWSSWSREFAFPGGEKIGDFVNRIESFMAVIDACEEENILVVAHGGVIRNFICLYLGLSPDKYLLFNVDAGCFSSLELYSEGAVLTALNAGK